MVEPYSDAMKRTLAIVAVVASALLLGGCTAMGAQDGGTSSSSVPSRDGGAVAPEIADGGKGVAFDEAAPGQVVENRAVITTGSVSLTVVDPLRSAEDAVRITEQAGGRIDSRSENPRTPNQPASANLSLRIPADKLDEALTQLKKLGTVNFVSLQASDVTQQTQDLDARIGSLRTSVDRLLALLSQATTTADLISIESALSSRQAELESLQSQREYLSDQIDYSTISLELNAVGTIAPGTPDSFWSAIVAGWNALITALGGFVVAVGFALPWVLALGVIAVLVLLVLRLTRRKGKAGMATPTPEPAAPAAPGA
jgi:hypothetical protein